MSDASAIHKLLRTSRRIERVMAKIYRALAAQHARDEVIAQVWSKAASEEDVHADKLRLATKFAGSGIGGTTVDQAEADEALQLAESILEGVLQHRHTARYALQEAVRMERAFAKYHAYLVSVFSDEQIKKLFESLRAADEQHIQDLEDALETVDEQGR